MKPADGSGKPSRMRRTAYVFAALAAVCAGLFALGPRASVEVAIRTPALPEDLDGYLSRSEARFADLRPGTQKTIVWADSPGARTPVAVVYLHGFSATRQEVRPLCDTLARRLHANLFYTRLAGHGRSDDALAEATAADWLNDGYEALAIGRRLGDRVILVGTSTGATLATWLAAQPDQADLLALVLLSPNFYPKDANARFLLWPWGTALARLVEGEYRTWTPHNAAQEKYWTTRYPSTALVTMMTLVDLVDRTDLGAVRQPVLVFYAPQDQVISAAKVEARFREFGSARKRLVAVEESGDPSHHILAGAVLSPDNTVPLADVILDFVRPLLPEDR